MDTTHSGNGSVVTVLSDSEIAERAEVVAESSLEANDAGLAAGYGYLLEVEQISKDACKRKVREIRKALAERDRDTLRVLARTALRLGLGK